MEQIEPASITIVVPNHMKKLAERINELNLAHNELKSAQDNYQKTLKKLNHAFEMQVKREQKHASKPKKERKACGFAVPVVVSDAMCDFMGVQHGTMISRTDITKQLNTYIKQQSLENPTNRQQIIPDEKLFSILSEGARSVVITHFNIQKYINHNFQVKKPAQEPVSVSDAQTTA